jgi:hypothetical protein
LKPSCHEQLQTSRLPSRCHNCDCPQLLSPKPERAADYLAGGHDVLLFIDESAGEDQPDADPQLLNRKGDQTCLLY